MNSYSYFVEVHKRRVHNTEKSFKCSVCDYAAKILCDLQNHKMRMHSTDRSYKCDVCEEGFTTATRRNNHIAQGKVVTRLESVFFLKHIYFLTHPCVRFHPLLPLVQNPLYFMLIKQKCHSYIHNINLIIHLMKMHTVSCFISGSSRVAAHKKTHAEREYVCTMCGKKFINKHKLKIHEDGVHGSDNLFPVITMLLRKSCLFRFFSNS